MKRHSRQSFATTRWSIVSAAGVDSGGDNQALAVLCEAYWPPVYAYIRWRGYQHSDAQDLTQAFFTRLIEKKGIAAADPARGRFRSFLLASIDNFLNNAHDRDQAEKRGGGRLKFSIDLKTAESTIPFEPADKQSPEKIYHRQWGQTLLALAMDRTQEEYQQAGKSQQFTLLSPALSAGAEAIDYEAASQELGLKTENLRQIAHRMRKRFGEILRKEVSRTVANPGDVDDELKSLFAIFEK